MKRIAARTLYTLEGGVTAGVGTAGVGGVTP